jgi:hypothetical protein
MNSLGLSVSRSYAIETFESIKGRETVSKAVCVIGALKSYTCQKIIPLLLGKLALDSKLCN